MKGAVKPLTVKEVAEYAFFVPRRGTDWNAIGRRLLSTRFHVCDTSTVVGYNVLVQKLVKYTSSDPKLQLELVQETCHYMHSSQQGFKLYIATSPDKFTMETRLAAARAVTCLDKPRPSVLQILNATPDRVYKLLARQLRIQFVPEAFRYLYVKYLATVVGHDATDQLCTIYVDYPDYIRAVPEACALVSGNLYTRRGRHPIQVEPLIKPAPSPGPAKHV